MASNKKASLATKPFVLVCLAAALGYMNQWVLVPVIPLYVDDLGASALVAGLVLLAFAIPSVVVRPVLGRLIDKWGSAIVVAMGLVAISAGALLMLAPLLAMLFVGNAVRGLGWAGVNTGAYTMLAITAPVERRGEASGYFSAVLTTVMIAFPVLGLWLLEHSGFSGTLVVAMLFSLLGLPVVVGLMKIQQRPEPEPGPAAGGAGLLDRSVLLPSAINLCNSLVYPALMAFLPLYARSLGVEDIAWFYVIAGIAGIFLRPLLGKQSDAIGRGPSIAIILTAQLAGLVLIMFAQGLGQILAGGVLVALSTAMIGSIATALAIDMSDQRYRGRAMATFGMSFQLGAGVGAVISGALADFVGFRGMYAGCAVITLAGLVALALAWKSLPPRPQRG